MSSYNKKEYINMEQKVTSFLSHLKSQKDASENTILSYGRDLKKFYKIFK